MPRLLRLLSISHSYGVRLNRRLAQEMAREGRARWEVTAAAPDYFHGSADLRPVIFQPAPEAELCRVQVVPARWTSRVHLFHYGRRLRSLLREDWDLVHAWEEPYITVGGQIALWTRPATPLVFATFQNLSKRYPPPFNWIERYAIGRSAGWVSLATSVAGALGGRVGYDRIPNRTIPMGVDVGVFRPDPLAGVAVRRSLRWAATGPPVIGYLGRFTVAKGVRVLMAALDAVATPWRALLVGAGSMEGEMRAWAASHGDRVRVCTDVSHEQVPRYLNAMDLLAAPSLTTPRWREQFGRMLIEAFACGIPVVGSDSGEIPHVIANAGLVVAEGDVAAWVKALGDLLDSPRRRAELAASGLNAAGRLYSWPVIARQYLEFFEQIIQSRGTADAGQRRRCPAPAVRESLYPASRRRQAT